ncbi:MAG: response regulator [Planctomycetes bacterium]|nr:response regulator [Planctomycetota bacterium]
MRALVIDDSAAMRNIISRSLVTIGFDVMQAVHGRDGLEKLKSYGKPEVILVDWNMPEMNGYEFIKAVRAIEAWRDIPLMMVTTETETSQVVRALAAGANEYLMKPFTPEMLSEKLAILGVTMS